MLVTAGANQAFTNTVIALLDECDACVLFAPIYFNHRMALQVGCRGDRLAAAPTGWAPAAAAVPQPLLRSRCSTGLRVPAPTLPLLPGHLQMTGGGDRVVLGPCHADTMHPDLDWLERQLAGPRPPKMVGRA